jgi:hypothetical protein
LIKELHPKIAVCYLSKKEVIKISELLGLNMRDKDVTSGRFEFYYEDKEYPSDEFM